MNSPLKRKFDEFAFRNCSIYQHILVLTDGDYVEADSIFFKSRQVEIPQEEEERALKAQKKIPYSDVTWTFANERFKFSGHMPGGMTFEQLGILSTKVKLPQTFMAEVFEEIKMKKQVFGTLGKEMLKREYISTVLYRVCYLFQNAKVGIEQELTGEEFAGNLDYKLEVVINHPGAQSEYVTFCIVEAKRDDVFQGFAQNVAQLFTLNAVSKKEVFGIVTVGLRWKFLKFVRYQAAESAAIVNATDDVPIDAIDDLESVCRAIAALLFQHKAEPLAQNKDIFTG